MSSERGQVCVVDAQDGGQMIQGGTARAMPAAFVLIDRCRPDADGGSEEGDRQARYSLASGTQPLTKAEIGR
jgi:hypothetical protein